MSEVRFASNNARIGDGIRITRVSGEGSTLEVMVDAKTGRYSEVILSDGSPVPVSGTAQIEALGTPMSAGLRYTPDDLQTLRLHADFITGAGMTDAELVAYLWDALKMAMSAPDA